MDFTQVRKLAKGVLVTERHVFDTVVDEGGQRSDSSRLLSSARTSGGDKQTGGLAVESARGPELASTVDEGLPDRSEHDCVGCEIGALRRVDGRSDAPSTERGSYRNGWEYRRGRRRTVRGRQERGRGSPVWRGRTSSSTPPRGASRRSWSRNKDDSHQYRHGTIRSERQKRTGKWWQHRQQTRHHP